MSKVWETEYLNKEEFDKETIFKYKKDSKLNYFEDYLYMLEEYPIGHYFVFIDDSREYSQCECIFQFAIIEKNNSIYKISFGSMYSVSINMEDKTATTEIYHIRNYFDKIFRK